MAKDSQFKMPQIFVLGDSQFAFGAGPTFHDFLENFAQNCGRYSTESNLVEKIDRLRVGVMGVRSTSLHSWVAHKWKRKKFVCEPDPKWDVNARLFGWQGRTDGTYVQLGRDRGFRICHSGQSAFEAVFDDMRRPELFFLFFTGNAVHRWANAPKRTAKDVKKLMAQIPPGVPCVFMTTVPSHRKKENDLRWKTQIGIRKAFEKYGPSCSFVEGHTLATVKEFQTQAKYFRRRPSGKVEDPYHPNKRGARKFVDMRRGAICTAVLHQFQRARNTATMAIPSHMALRNSFMAPDD
ncbi:MAG: SGNH/GDSL hydrolase family protein [Hyphomicrobiaceae bacterium]